VSRATSFWLEREYIVIVAAQLSAVTKREISGRREVGGSKVQNRLTSRIPIAGLALAWLVAGSEVAPAHAGSITYVTPAGSTAGGQPVDAEAVFTTGTGTITITLTNLQANPTSVVQNLSDLLFTVGQGTLNTSNETGATSQEITVNSGGSFSLGPMLTTPSAVGWIFSGSGTSGSLDVLAAGGAGPAHLIIGPPGTGGTYSNANGSIAGNGPHNPFLNQTASFTLTAPNISASSTITSATFSFGTTSGVNVVGQAVPEPSSLVMGLAALGLVGAVGLYRTQRRS
jgi:hypothetical protein